MSHTPVMLDEACEGLNLSVGGVYIDATFGRGGHSQAILSQIGPQGQLIAYDQDPDAIQHGRMHFKDDRLELRLASYESIYADMQQRGLLGKVSGILMDLGVSSPQLDEASRGFSFMKSGPLDMRMDAGLSGRPTAAQWLAQNDESTIANILYRYGEEKLSRVIARAIVHHLKHVGPIDTTEALGQLINESVGARYPKGKHPATRTFQALRIVVNDELNTLDRCLAQLIEVLKINGRLVVISFHSLEHRRVKAMMQRYLPGNEMIVDIQTPADTPRLKRIGGVVTAGVQEQAVNVRSRSAQCRVMEKVA
ncbi:MAG: hypothetical protein CMF51_01655 [Legionellales bacterium]|nr:hypothetical protein [Legionellales bacterium]